MEWKIKKNSIDSPLWSELKELPLLHNSSTPEQWQSDFDKRLSQITHANTDLSKKDERHPHFGPEFTFHLANTGYNTDAWAACINEMGLEMQKFRQRSSPDYEVVKNHLGGKGVLSQAPDRTSFGLPLAFQYSSLKGKGVGLESQKGERHGSLLHLRPVLINKKLHPLYLRLTGDVPGSESSKARIRGWRDSLLPFENNAMDQFMKRLKGVK